MTWRNGESPHGEFMQTWERLVFIISAVTFRIIHWPVDSGERINRPRVKCMPKEPRAFKRMG
jgi:hypothetical protein